MRTLLILPVLLLASSVFGAPMVVTWDPSTTAGVTYRVWLSYGGAPPVIAGTTAGTSFILPPLPPGTYAIHATSVVSTNESDPSNTWLVPPPVPVVTGTVVTTNVVVIPPPPTNTTVFVEAEGGITVPPMVLTANSLASGATYIRTTTANSGTASYLLTLPAGSYVLWGRVLVQNSSSDSFFVSMDGGPEDIWGNEAIISPNWKWTKVTGGNNGGPVKTFVLVAGTHTLKFRGREPNAGLDAIYITSNPSFTPP
jgi:hypothetical protein